MKERKKLLKTYIERFIYAVACQVHVKAFVKDIMNKVIFPSQTPHNFNLNNYL